FVIDCGTVTLVPDDGNGAAVTAPEDPKYPTWGLLGEPLKPMKDTKPPGSGAKSTVRKFGVSVIWLMLTSTATLWLPRVARLAAIISRANRQHAIGAPARRNRRFWFTGPPNLTLSHRDRATTA